MPPVTTMAVRCRTNKYNRNGDPTLRSSNTGDRRRQSSFLSDTVRRSFGTSLLPIIVVVVLLLQVYGGIVRPADAADAGNGGVNSGNRFGTTRALSMSRNNNNDNKEWECVPSTFQRDVLLDPCGKEMNQRAPDRFQLKWPVRTYVGGQKLGTFTTDCIRGRAPFWADRIYNLARNGFYNDNYFFRVIPGKWVQFGTHGVDPTVGRRYDYHSNNVDRIDADDCAVIRPQPPEMPRCTADPKLDKDCPPTDVANKIGLSNTFGTMGMSASYNQSYPGFDEGVSWNVTAELFINLGNNRADLDANLFVPICTIKAADMEQIVGQFVSFGECSDLGGPGPDLSRLYREGNAYIQANHSWDAMSMSSIVSVCSIRGSSSSGTSEVPKTAQASAITTSVAARLSVPSPTILVALSFAIAAILVFSRAQGKNGRSQPRGLPGVLGGGAGGRTGDRRNPSNMKAEIRPRRRRRI